MTEVNFYNIGTISKEKLKYVVIQAEYHNKWIVVRHRERDTWEIPGGHIEENEELQETASRELFEETGAKRFTLEPVKIYSVLDENRNIKTFGQLYYSKVTKFKKLPTSEIEEVKLVRKLPKKLTYPNIQPHLFQEVKKFLHIYSY